jgi:hypothetical protein
LIKTIWAKTSPQGGTADEVKVGTSMLMLGKAHGRWKWRPGTFYVYVENRDAAYQKALNGNLRLPELIECQDQTWPGSVG